MVVARVHEPSAQLVDALRVHVRPLAPV